MPSKKVGGAGNAGVAEQGRAVAARQKEGTYQAIRRAMEEIEKDIERNDGLYPLAGGEVSTAEVLRRAGKSSTLLQKPTHKELRVEVNAWVKGVQLKIKRGAKVVRRAVTERAQQARDEVSEIRQVWVEAELEYVHTTAKLAELTEKYALLEAENARLKASLAGSNVVSMNAKRDT